MRNEAELTADTITPATASGEQNQARPGRRRGASGVSGWLALVRVSGNSAAQHSTASRLYET